MQSIGFHDPEWPVGNRGEKQNYVQQKSAVDSVTGCNRGADAVE